MSNPEDEIQVDEENRLEVSIKEAKQLVIDCLYSNVVPFLRSSPALGKSSLIKAIAKMLNLKVIDLRLAQCDPTDLSGFPSIDTATNIARYVPMETFPIAGTPIPDGYAGWLLFLDEMNSAPPSVQAAAYKLVLDHQVGTHDLHKNCKIVCAGNLDTDGAITNQLSSAMVSRMVHLYMKPCVLSWLQWANQEGKQDLRIIGFLEWSPNNFYTFDPENPEQVYAAPRPWEFVNNMLGTWKKLSGEDKVERSKLPLLAGAVGLGVAASFNSYCALSAGLITMAQVLANPETAPIPGDPGSRYAMSAALAAHMDMDNIDEMLKYVDRMEHEHQIVIFRMAVQRNRALKQHPRLVKWAVDNSSLFFD